MAESNTAERPVFGPPRRPHMKANTNKLPTTPGGLIDNDSLPPKAVPFMPSRGEFVSTLYDFPAAGNGGWPKLVGSSHGMSEAEAELDLLELEEILASQVATTVAPARSASQNLSAACTVFATFELLEGILLLLDDKTPSVISRVCKSFQATVLGSSQLQMRAWLAADDVAQTLDTKELRRHRRKDNLTRPVFKHECLQKRFPQLKGIVFSDHPTFSLYSGKLELDPSIPPQRGLGSSSIYLHMDTGSDRWQLQVKVCLLNFVKMLGENITRRESGIEAIREWSDSHGVVVGYMTAMHRLRDQAEGSVELGVIQFPSGVTFEEFLGELQWYIADSEAEYKEKQSKASRPAHGSSSEMGNST